MKKIIFPAVAGLMLFASCKKDYTCTCTNTQTVTSGGVAQVSSGTSTTIYKDVKKSYVETKAECYEESYTYDYPDGQGGTVVVNYDWDCAISN